MNCIPDADFHTIAFSGCAAGSHGLTWAQQEGLLLLESVGFDTSRGNDARFDGPIDGRAALPDVLRAIARAVEHYDALRTRYRSGTGGAGFSATVAGNGQLAVPVYETDGGDAEQIAARVVEMLSCKPFTEGDLPIRAAVITKRSIPRWLALSVHHLSADGTATAVLHDRIRQLSVDPHAGFPPAWQPRDIEEFEQSAPGQREAALADERLLSQLREVAALGSVERPDTGHGHGFVAATLRSPAVAGAANLLAKRYRLSETVVITSAFASALGRMIGQDRYALLLASGNRGRPELRRSVANLSQLVPLVVDVRPDDFAEVCRRTALSSLRSYRIGHHDPVRYRATAEWAAAELSLNPSLPYLVNSRIDGVVAPVTDERHRQAPVRDSHDASRLVAESRARSVVEVLDIGTDPQYVSLCFSVFGADHLAMMGDRSAFSAAELEHMQRDLESLLVDAL